LANGLASNYFSTAVRKSVDKLVIGPLKLSISIDALWKLLWVDPDFNNRYRASRRETEVVVPDWEYNEDRTAGSRLTSCITIVEQPMPNTKTPLMEAQKFACSSVGGTKTLLVHLSSQTPDVISGKTFRVETLVEVVSADNGAASMMTVYAGVKKMSAGYIAVQMIVGRRAVSAVKEGYTLMVKMIHEYLGSQPPAIESPTVDDAAVTKQMDAVSVAPHTSAPAAAAPATTSAVTTGLLVVILCSVLVVGFDLSASRDSLQMVHRSITRHERLDRRGSRHATQRGTETDTPASTAPKGKDEVPRWGGVVVAEVTELRDSLSNAYWWISVQGLVFVAVLLAAGVKFLLNS
jgi:hypothetical protein